MPLCIAAISGLCTAIKVKTMHLHRCPRHFVNDLSRDPLTAFNATRSKCLVFFYSVNPGDEEDEGQYQMKQMGLDSKKLSKGPVAAMTNRVAPPAYIEWDGTAAVLEKSALDFLGGFPKYEPKASAKRPKGPTGKKKKSKGKSKDADL